MRTWIIAVIAAFSGLALGGGIAWSEFAGARVPLPGRSRPPTDAAAMAPMLGAQPKVVVEGGVRQGAAYTHDFGVGEVGVTGSYSFTVSNTGEAPLTLRRGEFSCSCTTANIEEGEQIVVPPGESTEVNVEYTPKEYATMFEHGGEIHTNDPTHPVIRLKINGRVTESFRMVPDDLVFGGISATEAYTASLTIYGYRDERVEVADHQFLNPETADNFTAAFRPLSREELAQEPDARSGVEVAVTTKPGLPLGPINQRIRLTLSREDVSPITAEIRGRVVGDFSLIGPGYDAQRDRLRLGTVKRAEGASRTVQVMVKGPHRGEVELKIGRVAPESSLQAELGEPREVNKGAVVMVPLTVRVPPDAPRGDYLGLTDEPMGEIVLETTHPAVKTLTINVSFLVE